MSDESIKSSDDVVAKKNARMRLRAAIRMRKSERGGRDVDRGASSSFRNTTPGGTGSLEQTLLQMCGDDPQAMQAMMDVMRDPARAVRSLSSGEAPHI